MRTKEIPLPFHNNAPDQGPQEEVSQISDTGVENAPRPFKTAVAAKKLNKSKSWLDKARSKGVGPRYIKIGGEVFYTDELLAEYLAAHTRARVWQFGEVA